MNVEKLELPTVKAFGMAKEIVFTKMKWIELMHA